MIILQINVLNQKYSKLYKLNLNVPLDSKISISPEAGHCPYSLDLVLNVYFKE